MEAVRKHTTTARTSTNWKFGQFADFSLSPPLGRQRLFHHANVLFGEYFFCLFAAPCGSHILVLKALRCPMRVAYPCAEGFALPHAGRISLCFVLRAAPCGSHGLVLRAPRCPMWVAWPCAGGSALPHAGRMTLCRRLSASGMGQPGWWRSHCGCGDSVHWLLVLFQTSHPTARAASPTTTASTSPM